MGSAGQGSPLGQVGWRGGLWGPGAPVNVGPRWDCFQRQVWNHRLQMEPASPPPRTSPQAVPEDTPTAGDANTPTACPQAMCARESERKRGVQLAHPCWCSASRWRGAEQGLPFPEAPLYCAHKVAARGLVKPGADRRTGRWGSGGQGGLTLGSQAPHSYPGSGFRGWQAVALHSPRFLTEQHLGAWGPLEALVCLGCSLPIKAQGGARDQSPAYGWAAPARSSCIPHLGHPGAPWPCRETLALNQGYPWKS